MIRYIKKGIDKLLAELALLSVELLVLIAIFSTALISFILIAREVFRGDTHAFDERVFAFIATRVSDVHTSVMQFFTFLGTHTFLIPANLILTAWFLFVQKRRWNSIKIPAVALSSLLLMFLLKFLFHRARPLDPLLYEAKGFSFPSGHALMSVTFYGLMILITWMDIKRTWLRWALSILLVLLIFIIGLSRIYLRVHYASDVLAGFSVGLVWLLLSLWVLGKIEKYTRRKVVVKDGPNE